MVVLTGNCCHPGLINRFITTFHHDGSQRWPTVQGAKGPADQSLAQPSGADTASKEEADNRSVYVGQVDYSATPEELQVHFKDCGTVNRVTILTDKMGNAKVCTSTSSSIQRLVGPSVVLYGVTSLQ